MTKLMTIPKFVSNLWAQVGFHRWPLAAAAELICVGLTSGLPKAGIVAQRANPHRPTLSALS